MYMKYVKAKKSYNSWKNGIFLDPLNPKVMRWKYRVGESPMKNYQHFWNLDSLSL